MKSLADRDVHVRITSGQALTETTDGKAALERVLTRRIALGNQRVFDVPPSDLIHNPNVARCICDTCTEKRHVLHEQGIIV